MSKTTLVSGNLRLDKWLWAARFFKTRALAKAAIENGKIHYDGQRPKVSRTVIIGAFIQIKQGWDIKEIEVLVLSSQRGPAVEAQKLYQETETSLQRRQAAAENRRLTGAATQAPTQRPDKKSRRQIHRFKRQEN